MTRALFETDVGNINIEFYSSDAPNTVNNFTKLISEGFYDGLTFHRVIPGFMAQGGCPNTREGASGMPGTGGPGYNIKCEINQNKHLKGVLLSNMILDIYRGCFERVYIASPSINVDHTWIPVKEYLDKTINLSENEPPLYYDHYDPESLEQIIDTQKKVTEHLKSKKDNKKLYSILIIVDDFADDPLFSRKSQLLHSLFTRGRHSQISTIISTQKFASLHPIIRVNTKILHVFRLRNYQDLQMFLDEVSALIDKKSLMEIFSLATS